MTIETRIFLLKAASIITLLTGLGMATAAIPALAGPTTWFVDITFWPLDGAQDMTDASTRLLTAITGGVLTGWSVMIWMVAGHLFHDRPGASRKIILSSVTAWFVADCSMSVAAGAPGNILGNLGFLVIFLVPLITPVQSQAAALDQ